MQEPPKYHLLNPRAEDVLGGKGSRGYDYKEQKKMSKNHASLAPPGDPLMRLLLLLAPQLPPRRELVKVRGVDLSATDGDPESDYTDSDDEKNANAMRDAEEAQARKAADEAKKAADNARTHGPNKGSGNEASTRAMTTAKARGEESNKRGMWCGCAESGEISMETSLHYYRHICICPMDSEIVVMGVAIRSRLTSKPI